MKLFVSLALSVVCFSAHAERQILSRNTKGLVIEGFSYGADELFLKVNSRIPLAPIKRPTPDSIANEIEQVGELKDLSSYAGADARSAGFENGLQQGYPAVYLVRFLQPLSFSSISNTCQLWRMQAGDSASKELSDGSFLAVEKIYYLTLANGRRTIFARAYGNSGDFGLLCDTTNSQVPATSALILGMGAKVELVSGASTSYRTQIIPASQLGLESVYQKAVPPRMVCNPGRDLRYQNSCSDICRPDLITKCDGSLVGWVERTGNGADLEANTDGSFTFHVAVDNEDKNYLNIYSCGVGDNRPELKGDTQANPNKAEVKAQLDAIAKSKSNFKIQLFFNKFIMSGKCIGKIEVLK